MGSLLSGLGAGGNKYIDLQEKQRAEEAAQANRLEQMDYAANKGQEIKDQERAKLKNRQMAFQSAAVEWRKENPTASISDFITHFAGTEHADLLEPTIKAAQYKDSALEKEAAVKLRELQGKEYEARTKFYEGAKTQSEEALAAQRNAKATGAGAKGPGMTEKDYEHARGEVLHRNVLKDATGEPNTLANAALASNLDKFYQASHNLAQAERYAVNATKAGLAFADKQATKAGGEVDPGQFSMWLDQGAQKYTNDLAERVRQAKTPTQKEGGEPEKPAAEGKKPANVPKKEPKAPETAKFGLLQTGRLDYLEDLEVKGTINPAEKAELDELRASEQGSVWKRGWWKGRAGESTP